MFGAFLLGRRSRRIDDVPVWPEDEPDMATAPTPPAASPSPDMSTPLPTPIFARPFDITFEPQRMTLAMINASLTYRLTITNRDDRPLGPLRITCDLISAHASLLAAEQLTPDPDQAWLSHDFEALPPAGDLVVNGEVKLPRAEILPVRNGQAYLFVPLARFTVQIVENGIPQTIGARVFVIGEEPGEPEAALKPFRLNEGTRSYSRIGQRDVTLV